jgi:hypothetical protein
MAFRKREYPGYWKKKKHYTALCGQLALAEALNLS